VVGFERLLNSSAARNAEMQVEKKRQRQRMQTHPVPEGPSDNLEMLFLSIFCRDKK